MVLVFMFKHLLTHVLLLSKCVSNVATSHLKNKLLVLVSTFMYDLIMLITLFMSRHVYVGCPLKGWYVPSHVYVGCPL